jgi:hypothetical protein
MADSTGRGRCEQGGKEGGPEDVEEEEHDAIRTLTVRVPVPYPIVWEVSMANKKAVAKFLTPT